MQTLGRLVGALFGVPLRWKLWTTTLLCVLLLTAFRGDVPAASALGVGATIPAALVDVRIRRLPDRLLALAAVVLAVGIAIGAVISEGVDPLAVVAGAAAMATPVLIVHVISPTSMGFGDVKAAIVLGAAIGTVHWQLALSALALAAGFSTTAALLARARTIPFGPGLVSGATVALAFAPVFMPSPERSAERHEFTVEIDTNEREMP